MERKIDYKSLYALQDRVLQVMVSLENDFYLTGGTALHRFYYNSRYSDDLDFFVSNGTHFNEDVEEIILELSEQEFQVVRVVNSRDFYRIRINDFLQVDFVNDRVFRYKKSIIFNKLKVDNKLNILTNKISAIISRDEEKDIFDLFCFLYNEQFNWKTILEIASKKTTIEKDILIYRLKNFPLIWLDKIKSLKTIEITEEKIDVLCDDILNEQNNSLKMITKEQSSN